MASSNSISKDSESVTSDEDNCSGDEEKSNGRRRRFCIERRKDSPGPSETSAPRRTRPDAGYRNNRICSNKLPYKRRRVLIEPTRHLIYPVISHSSKHEPQTNTAPRRPIQQQPQQPSPAPQLQKQSQPSKLESTQPKRPVIYINPRFVKRFIEKSIQLAASKSVDSIKPIRGNKTAPVTDGSTTNKTTTNAPSASTPIVIADINFKTSPPESLQAASTMAVIRLVTECIEDDSKRDEKLNKILVARLIDELSSLAS